VQILGSSQSTMSRLARSAGMLGGLDVGIGMGATQGEEDGADFPGPDAATAGALHGSAHVDPDPESHAQSIEISIPSLLEPTPAEEPPREEAP